MNLKINWRSLITQLAIPLAVGILASLLTQSNFYQVMQKPPLSPPAWLFPIVWTVLYILMGISAYLIEQTPPSPQKDMAQRIYAVQLFLNFIWSPIFFNLQSYGFAFFILLLLWVCIILMILSFRKISPIAAYLQIPYLLWVTFAGYLNLAIYLIN